MPDTSLTYNELEKRLNEAEDILNTLRNHKVDAVIGTDQIAMMRLKEVEDQLHDQIKISRNRLNEIESIYQNVPVGLCILDTDLKFIRINGHLAEMNGIPAEEHIGKSIHELLPNIAGNIQTDLHRVIETGKARMNVELSGETPAQPGVIRYWLQHWLPLYNKQEQVIGINMVIQEVTDRKKYEDKLQRLNELLEERVAERTNKLREMALQITNAEEKERQRLARVLHDGLQQLLIGAKFNANLIKKHLPTESKVIYEINHLVQILDQSIEASRSLSYELSPPILHDHGLTAALHWLAGMRHMQGLSIDIKVDENLPTLSQNLKVFLFQAIRELLINVIKHAGVDKAEVHISFETTIIRIEVIDEGKGFDTEEVEQKASESLGLRSIREKLDLMNGRLEIKSEPGQGSQFILEVPVGEKVHSSEPAESSQDPTVEVSENTADKPNSGNSAKSSSSSISVLVVDDHQVMRDGLVSLLNEESDINIIGEASNGIEAVDFVRETPPDVIIMDITMPGMDGIEATRQIHQEFPEILIIGLSMHEEEEYTTRIKEAGAVGLLNKGGPAEHLFKSIRNINIKV